MQKKKKTPGDSKSPFDPLVGGHLARLLKGHVFTTPKKGPQQNCQAGNFQAVHFMYLATKTWQLPHNVNPTRQPKPSMPQRNFMT